jgi:ABC-2 type transport system ATP-binding protein
MMKKSVEITGLTVVRGGRTVLEGLDLTIGEGVTGLLGPSGCGKSTLMRCLAGVQRVASGEVTILGEPAGSAALRHRLGYVTQAASVYDDLTVVENLRFFSRVLGVERSDVDQAVAAVDLDSHRDQVVGRLSGGERSRASLAVALLGSPDLLVLDEPATGLDPEQRLQLRSLLSQSRTVVMSTHNVSEVAALCQVVYVMFGGRIRFAGSPAELAALADGRVWEDDRQDPDAIRSWVTATGTFRHLGEPPAGATVVAPTLDDGYLLLSRREHR